MPPFRATVQYNTEYAGLDLETLGISATFGWMPGRVWTEGLQFNIPGQPCFLLLRAGDLGQGKRRAAVPRFSGGQDRNPQMLGYSILSE